MKKNRYNYFIFIILFFSFLLFFTNINANENKKFLTLKNIEVNLRQGPSFEYPIKLIYKKKYLTVIISDKLETRRKIKDFENYSGWINISKLSKRKSGINIKNNSIIYKKPTIYSKPIAKLEVGRLVLIKKCKTKWCKITTGGYSGWIFKDSVWGKIYAKFLTKFFFFNNPSKSLLNLGALNFIFFKFYFRSKRSRFITFVHADIKSARNLDLESSQA